MREGEERRSETVAHRDERQETLESEKERRKE
jgi:hypothetical protein